MTGDITIRRGIGDRWQGEEREMEEAGRDPGLFMYGRNSKEEDFTTKVIKNTEQEEATKKKKISPPRAPRTPRQEEAAKKKGPRRNTPSPHALNHLRRGKASGSWGLPG